MNKVFAGRIVGEFVNSGRFIDYEISPAICAEALAAFAHMAGLIS